MPNICLHLFCNRHDKAHEDQRMICNNAYSLIFSKALNVLNIAKLLRKMHSVSDWHSITHDATYTVSIKLYLQSMLKCTKHISIDYCPKTVLRKVCKVCLEGRGNSDWRNVQSLGLYFLGWPELMPLFEASPPTHCLMPTVLNSCCQKSWTQYIHRRWKSLYQRIIVQLTILLLILGHVRLPQVCQALSLYLSLSSEFLHTISFLWKQFCHLFKIKLIYYRMTCFMLGGRTLKAHVS